MPYSLSLGGQPERWLMERSVTDPALAQTVATWLRDVLCDDDAEVDSLPLVADSGQHRYVSRVPGTSVDVTWLEAAPFRTMKVLWIEEDL